MKLKSKRLKHISFNCKTSFCNDNDLKTEMLCECDHVLANCSFELESVDIISTLLVDALTFFDSNTENTKYYRTMIVLATKRIFLFLWLSSLSFTCQNWQLHVKFAPINTVINYNAFDIWQIERQIWRMQWELFVFNIFILLR